MPVVELQGRVEALGADWMWLFTEAVEVMPGALFGMWMESDMEPAADSTAPIVSIADARAHRGLLGAAR